MGLQFRRRIKFQNNSAAENNPTSAYTSISFTNRTSTYTITFMQHRKGRLESGLISLVIRDISKIFSAREIIFLMFLVEYSAAEAPGLSMTVCPGTLYPGTFCL